jgi:hypothetical protein
MLDYLLVIFAVLFMAWVAAAYSRERKYRSKPYFRLSEIGWQKTTPPPKAKVVHSVALVGDFGSVAVQGNDPVKEIIQQWVAQTGPASTIVFLGDNIYPNGLPPEGDRRRPHAEQVLKSQFEMLQGHQGRTIYLSGNHDWNKGKADGYGYLLRQEEYIRQQLGAPESFLPRNGCPGPIPMQVAEGVLLIVINTQWWVQRGDRPIGKTFSCEVESQDEFFAQFKRLLHQNQHQRILVAAHHPLYSNALHGGKFKVKQHLFPLTALHKKIYLPLPVAGSVYPLYRQMFGAYEDMSHPRYKRMRKRLLNILHRYSNVVYAAGHDHNLQYFFVQGNHYLVSGSGSKLAYVKKGGKAHFAHEEKGFMVVDYYDTGEAWLHVLEPSVDEKGQTVPLTAFRKRIVPPVAHHV